MESKIVLITGATGDIGKAITERLCEERYKPILVSRTYNKLNAFVQQIKSKYEIDAFSFCCDVSKKDEVYSFLEKMNQSNYQIHILVNCAGISCGGNTTDITEDDWDNVIATNLNSVFLSHVGFYIGI